MRPADTEQFSDYDREMLIHRILQQDEELRRLRSKTLDDLVQDMIDLAIAIERPANE